MSNTPSVVGVIYIYIYIHMYIYIYTHSAKHHSKLFPEQ